MAGFKTHITVSSLAGIGFAGAGCSVGIPVSSCLVGGGLCSIAGMLPDLDSGSGVPMRETTALVAAVVPVLMIPRFVQLGMNTEQMALAAGAMYLAIRFGVAKLFNRYTVHRGMWHSVPAAAIVGLAAFLIVSGSSLDIRLFKAAAVVFGFLIHLVLDEFWSFEMRRGRLRVKRSLGTALKFWTGRSLWANFSTYGKLGLLVAIVIGDPYLMEELGVEQPDFALKSKQWAQSAVERGQDWVPDWDLATQSQRLMPLVDGPPDASAEAPLDAPAEALSADEAWLRNWPQAETARRAYDYPTRSSPVQR